MNDKWYLSPQNQLHSIVSVAADFFPCPNEYTEYVSFEAILSEISDGTDVVDFDARRMLPYCTSREAPAGRLQFKRLGVASECRTRSLAVAARRRARVAGAFETAG